MLRDGHMPIVPLCAVDDNDMNDVGDDDAPVLSPRAGDELGREDLAAHVVPAFHHSAELPPDHDVDENEDFVDN